MEEPTRFEPRPVLPRRRAGWNRLAVLVPVLALAIAAWAGTSGPRSGAEVAAQPSGSGVAASSAASPPAAALAAPPVAPDYPATVLGLDVQTLGEVNGGLHGDAIEAVVGWYVASSNPACPSPSGVEPSAYVAELGVVADAQTFCLRSGVLLAAPFGAGPWNTATEPVGNGFQAAGDPTLTVIFTPGMAVPFELDRNGSASARVILVGRVVLPAPLCSGRPSCRGELFVDRVVWAAGLGQTQTTTILPTLLDVGPRLAWRPRDSLARAAVGSTGALLMETLVDRSTLAAVDPAAAAVIATSSPAAERIWYRRALAPDPAREAPSWVAIDDATGKVIGSGSVERSAQP